MKENNFKNLDLNKFAEELEQIKKEAIENIGQEDLNHLKKIDLWGKLCTISGYLTACLAPNPISAFLISQGNITRWAMITHHISHKGYDKIKGVPKKYNSKYYAKGKRRYLDWLEWMHPEAWSLEHNLLHHYHTGEKYDPDLVVDNVKLMRRIKAPTALKYLVILFFMSHWKASYYAPNTMWVLEEVKNRKKSGNKKIKDIMENKKSAIYPGAKLFIPNSKTALIFWVKCLIPYALIRFYLIPLLFSPFGKVIKLNILINSILAEIITNIHSFMIIVPNHAGEDVYQFDEPIKTKNEFYLRQIIGSVNYSGGSNIKDFLQGWLNYQIEHHLWSDLPMLKYREIQPKVEAVCKKHNVPYVKENLFKRFKKLIDIMVGKKDMKKLKWVDYYEDSD